MAWKTPSDFEELIDDLLIWLRAGMGLIACVWLFFLLWLSGKLVWTLVDTISAWLA